ncbi:MAG: oligosaccharide flippase family protein [Erythrobacter sp.]|nr:oligosaccharide flippase family protein [Erythrobacter sp.]
MFRNGAWLFSAKGFGAFAGLFYLAAVTRTLGPAGFGKFILIVSTVQILAATIKLQTWQTVVHFGAPALAAHDRGGFSRMVLGDLVVEAVGSAISFALLFAFAEPIALRMGWEADLAHELVVYGAIVFLSMRSTSTGVLRACDRFRDAAMGDAAIPLTRFVGAMVMLAIGPDVMGFLIVWGLSELVSSLVQAWLVWRARLVGRPGPARRQAGYWTFLFTTNASYLLTVLRERGAVLVVGLFVGETAAGLFRLADQLASSVNRLTEIFSRPLFTEMSRLYGAGEQQRSRDLFFRSLRISAITGGAMMLAMLLLGKPIIWLMSGDEFLPAYPFLLYLGASTIIGLASLGLEPLLQAAGRPFAAFLARLAGLAAIGVGLALWIIPYGVIGASWAMFAGALATLVAHLWVSFRLMRRRD